MESELLNKTELEKTNASAFGDMKFVKNLLSFKLKMSSVSYVIPVFNKSKFLKPVM